MRHADIRGIDVAIDVEVANIAVALFAHMIRQPAHGQQIVRFIEREAVGGIKPHSRQHFFRDGFSRASLICKFAVGQFMIIAVLKFAAVSHQCRRAPEQAGTTN